MSKHHPVTVDSWYLHTVHLPAVGNTAQISAKEAAIESDIKDTRTHPHKIVTL